MPANVTIPVSCGRGDSSLKMTPSFSLTKNSTPQIPAPVRAEPQAVESPATPADASVARRLAEAVKAVSGVEARPIGIGGGTVGAYLRQAGYQAVVWSRMDETAHQPNEYTVIENLVHDSQVMAYMMMKE